MNAVPTEIDCDEYEMTILFCSWVFGEPESGVFSFVVVHLVACIELQVHATHHKYDADNKKLPFHSAQRRMLFENTKNPYKSRVTLMHKPPK